MIVPSSIFQTNWNVNESMWYTKKRGLLESEFMIAAVVWVISVIKKYVDSSWRWNWNVGVKNRLYAEVWHAARAFRTSGRNFFKQRVTHWFFTKLTHLDARNKCTLIQAIAAGRIVSDWCWKYANCWDTNKSYVNGHPSKLAFFPEM